MCCISDDDGGGKRSDSGNIFKIEKTRLADILGIRYKKKIGMKKRKRKEERKGGREERRKEGERKGGRKKILTEEGNS